MLHLTGRGGGALAPTSPGWGGFSLGYIRAGLYQGAGRGGSLTSCLSPLPLYETERHWFDQQNNPQTLVTLQNQPPPHERDARRSPFPLSRSDRVWNPEAPGKPLPDALSYVCLLFYTFTALAVGSISVGSLPLLVCHFSVHLTPPTAAQEIVTVL